MKPLMRPERILVFAAVLFVLAVLFGTPSLSPSFSSGIVNSASDAVIQQTAPTTTQQAPVPRSLWVGEENTAVAVTLGSGQPALYIQTQLLQDIAADNTRSLVWVGTVDNIIQYNFDGAENFRRPIRQSASTQASAKQAVTTTTGPAEDRIRLALDPSDGSLWVGAGQELIKLSSDNRELFRTAGFEHIADVAVDISDGSCWVAEKHRISKYASDGTALFNVNIGEYIFITALAADPASHALWVGTEQGLGKLDAQGQELFRTTEPVGIRDMAINIATGALWLVTKQEVYKYSKDNQKLLMVPLCQDIQQATTKDPQTQKTLAGSATKEATQSTSCESEFAALAVDSIDNTVWVATKNTISKGSDAGDMLLTVPGFINIQALDIGLPKLGITITDPKDGAISDKSPIMVKGVITDPTATVDVNGIKATVTNLDFEAQGVILTSGTNTITAMATNLARQKAAHSIHVTYNPPDTGPTLLVCPEPYGEQRPHPPTPGCAQQVMLGDIHWDRGYVLGQVDDSAETIIVDGISLIFGGSIYNQGRIQQAGWQDTFFWARLLLSGPDGSYPVTAAVANAEGNTASATVTFIKDSVAPNIAITAPPDGTLTRDSAITIRGTVDDPLALLRLDLDGSNIPAVNGTFTTPYTMGTIDGPQYISLTATDPAGNQGSAFITVIRDATPPQIAVTAPGDGAATNSQTIGLSGTITDQHPGSATVSVNVGPAQPLNISGTSFSGTTTLANGVNALLFTAADTAGNISTLSRSVILDQEPPTATVSGIDPNAVISGTATITATASDVLSGIQSVTLLVDGIVKTTLTQGPYTFNLDSFGLAAGNHTITIRVLDRAGNVTEQNIPVTVPHQFGIQITSPGAGATINKSSALIRGTINQPAGQEIGVVVNGIPAEQQGNIFAAIIPLQQGQNTITATATNIYGIQEQTTITINADSIQDQLRFTVSSESGITTTKPDGTTNFATTMNVESYVTGTIASYAWDTNGDGTADQTGELLTQITATYQTPGLYFPTVTVADTIGNTYTETAIVNVIDRNSVDTLLQSKWEGMKGAAISGNTEGAMAYFMPGAQDRYRAIFTDSSRNIAARLSEIIRIESYAVYGKVAQCIAIRHEADGDYGYPLTFVKDGNGIWKILGF